MASFDVNNYLIKEKLPEWYKNDTFLEPLNAYTQNLIIDMVSGLLNNLGVVQPFNVWKWLPEEYNWTHNYYSSDEYLEGRDATLKPGFITHAIVPNTKRNCNAIIKLELTGNNRTTYDENGEFDKQHQENVTITIRNAFQELKIKDVNNLSTIEIYTKNNDILINGVENYDLVEGRIDNIQPIPKYSDYKEPYIDEDGQKKYKHIDISDENKITRLELTSDKEVNFNLSVELIKPVYVTEQHIRLSSVSAFPLDWVKLFGFYCHDFNDQEGYRLLWEKTYKEEDRVVYDRITKQYDCERFYIQIKLHGIGAPISYGFPQQELSENPAFAINRKLDKWGEIYGLPRRIYRENISEEDEPDTFPQYYNYPIEQDYWYEERMVNEYRYNDNAVDGFFVKDTDLNNVILLESISPHINDVWIFSETIVPVTDINKQTGEIYPCKVIEQKDHGVPWEFPQALKKKTLISKPITLKPNDGETLGDFSYTTQSLKLRYDLRNLEIPKNVEITGMQLKFYAETDMHSSKLALDPVRSKMLLNSIYTRDNGDRYSVQEKVDIAVDIQPWKKGQKQYKLGGKNFLFNQETINRDQLFRKFDDEGEESETGYLDFILAFVNNHEALTTKLLLHTVTLEIFYKLYQDKFSLDMILSNREIVLSRNEKDIKMKINVKNTGMTEIEHKKIFIAIPPELEIEDNKYEYDFNLDIGESFTIGDGKSLTSHGNEYNDPTDIIRIKPKKINGKYRTGKYDVIVFCDDKVIKEEITVRQGFAGV